MRRLLCDQPPQPRLAPAWRVTAGRAGSGYGPGLARDITERADASRDLGFAGQDTLIGGGISVLALVVRLAPTPLKEVCRARIRLRARRCWPLQDDARANGGHQGPPYRNRQTEAAPLITAEKEIASQIMPRGPFWPREPEGLLARPPDDCRARARVPDSAGWRGQAGPGLRFGPRHRPDQSRGPKRYGVDA